MKSIRITHLRWARAALLCSVIPVVTALAADATPIVAQQLVSPKASSKVEAVLWTRRSDRYTLQVVLPRTGTGIRITPLTIKTSVMLWLLKADGTAIPVNTVPAAGPNPGPVTNEVAYWVSLAAGETAVAVALKIDDEYFVEALQKLN